MSEPYVCLTHPTAPLSDVRTIRADIWRPPRAKVIGVCAECTKQRPKKAGRYRTTTKRTVWSYGAARVQGENSQ